MQSQTWDPSVKSLCAFPTVLTMMNEKIDWTQKLGDAFLAQQKEVMQAVQVLRGKAKETGNLKSTKEVTVKEEPAPAGSPAPQTIIIESPDPEVVYVPTYNPTVVYGAWAYPYYPPYYYYPPGYAYGAAFWSFTAGVIVGGAIWGNCNWGGNDVDIDINRQNNFNRNEINTNRNSNNSGNRAAIAPATRRPIAPATTSRAGRTTPSIARAWATRTRPRSRNSARARASRPCSRASSIAAAPNRAASRCRAKATGNQRDMAGNSIGSRDAGGASTRDLGGGSRATWAATTPARATWVAPPRATWAAAGAGTLLLRRDFGGSSSRSSSSRSSGSRSSGAFGGGGGSSARMSSSRGGMSRRWRRRAAAMNREDNEMRTTTLLVLIASFAVLTACAPSKPQNFETPEAAVQALIDAAQTGETKPVLKVLGEGRQTAHRLGRSGRGQEWARRIRRRATTKRIRSTRPSRTRSRWKWARTSGRSPSRIVKGSGGWHFDSAAGAEEIINRRVGENELDTIQSCLAYVDAQREYYQRNPQNDSMLHYASRLISTEGKKDGLYWPAGENEEQSPLGEGFARARAEGYEPKDGTMKGGPFHGYVYRVADAAGTERPGRRLRLSWSTTSC